LVADPENEEGMAELSASITDGFNDTDAIQAVLLDDRLTSAAAAAIREILDGMQEGT